MSRGSKLTQLADRLDQREVYKTNTSECTENWLANGGLSTGRMRPIQGSTITMYPMTYAGLRPDGTAAFETLSSHRMPFKDPRDLRRDLVLTFSQVVRTARTYDRSDMPVEPAIVAALRDYAGVRQAVSVTEEAAPVRVPSPAAAASLSVA